MPSTTTDAPCGVAAASDVLRAELGELLDGAPPPCPPAPAALDWAASGAMHLTGRPGEAPRLAPGAPASWMRAAGDLLGGAVGDPAALLGERAACAGLERQAPRAVGGAYRTLRARDGWVGLTLARRSDLELLPALVAGPVACDPWATLATWAARQESVEIERRLRLLGLPGARIPAGPRPSYRPAVRLRRGGARSGGARRRAPAPLVVDLTALWAGPLCANVLGNRGARVIKVESIDRPDGARRGPAPFFDLLHGGHECIALDFASATGRRALAGLVRRADVVLESSRPRALRQLGLIAEEHVAAGTVWVSITAYGRDDPHRVGFGDDVAAAAGLVVDDGLVPYPVGDAIADPLTGLTAAAAAAVAMRSGRGWLVDVSMRDVAAAAARIGGDDATVTWHDGAWRVRSAGREAPVRPPRARRVARAAGALGADTERVLAEFGLGR